MAILLFDKKDPDSSYFHLRRIFAHDNSMINYIEQLSGTQLCVVSALYGGCRLTNASSYDIKEADYYVNNLSMIIHSIEKKLNIDLGIKCFNAKVKSPLGRGTYQKVYYI